jgi:hypothetical protein
LLISLSISFPDSMEEMGSQHQKVHCIAQTVTGSARMNALRFALYPSAAGSSTAKRCAEKRSS